MGRVLAVCGMPASGKGVFAAILKDRGIPILSMGDMIREEVRHRQLQESPEIFGEIASQLRQEFGEEVLASRLMKSIFNLQPHHALILIEGMRGTAELEEFRTHLKSDLIVVGIHADKETRFSRVLKRKRSEDGNRSQFEIRENREKGWGLETLIQNADKIIENESTIQEFSYEVLAWLNAL